MKKFIKNLIKYYGKELLALVIEIAIIASQPVKTVTSIDVQGQGLELTAIAWGAIVLLMITVGTIAAKIENNIIDKKAKKVVVSVDELNKKTETPAWLKEAFARENI